MKRPALPTSAMIRPPPTRSRRQLGCALALGLTLGVGTSSAGWAQLLGNGPVGTQKGVAGTRAPASATKPVIPEPEAIPGSKPRQAAAPPTHSPTDLPPTDALFDAINRGDIASARDALNRGADLNGINILGMTPMELSVDLGRNDISFLLLSMRGEDSGRGSRAVGRDGGSRAAGQEATVPPTRKSAQAIGPKAAGRTVTGTPGQVAAKSALAPKLFANDGGAPVPGVGFLGFDAGHTAN